MSAICSCGASPHDSRVRHRMAGAAEAVSRAGTVQRGQQEHDRRRRMLTTLPGECRERSRMTGPIGRQWIATSRCRGPSAETAEDTSRTARVSTMRTPIAVSTTAASSSTARSAGSRRSASSTGRRRGVPSASGASRWPSPAMAAATSSSVARAPDPSRVVEVRSAWDIAWPFSSDGSVFAGARTRP